MRKILLCFFAFVTVLACSKTERNIGVPEDVELSTKAGAPFLAADYFVSEDDVLNFIEKRLKYQELSEDPLALIDVEPLYYQGVVVFYLAHFNTRWELYASDKRLPHILAFSESEEFDYSFFMGDNSIWADNYVMATYRLRTDPYFLGTCNEDRTEIAENIKFWNGDESRMANLASRLPAATRDGGGHWELTDSYTDYVFYSQTGHMLPTMWNQGGPFNNACPENIGQLQDLINHRSYCGSEALAAALLLYYYHTQDGVPVTAPTNGTVLYTVVDSTVVFYGNFTQYTSTVWNSMSSVPDSCAALIGRLWLDTHTDLIPNGYPNGSIDFFVNYRLDDWGLDGQIINYDRHVIDSTLISGYPIWVHAASRAGWFFGDEYYNYHSYLIDAYRLYRLEHYFYYEWIPDEPDPMQMIPAPIKVVEYDDPVIRYYGIHFCEGDNASAVWFSASSAIQYYGNTYQYNRRILSGVCVLDE